MSDGNLFFAIWLAAILVMLGIMAVAADLGWMAYIFAALWILALVGLAS